MTAPPGPGLPVLAAVVIALSALAVLVLATALGVFLVSGPSVPADAPSTPPAGVTWLPPVEEDSPEWDCATMGNRICGPTATLHAAGGAS